MPSSAEPPSAVVLVEGRSDQRAVETLARRQGRDLAAEGIDVVPMGGVTNVRRFLRLYGTGVRITGLCDAPEADYVRRVADQTGSRATFFACEADLEDELIRALGVEAVAAVIEAEGELPSYRLLQRQPAQRERAEAQQLHRFFGSHSGRKLRYAGLLVDALHLERTPAPLAALLADPRSAP